MTELDPNRHAPQEIEVWGMNWWAWADGRWYRLRVVDAAVNLNREWNVTSQTDDRYSKCTQSVRMIPKGRSLKERPGQTRLPDYRQ